MSEWLPIATAPMRQPVLVAFHGHGENRVVIATKVKNNGYWGDWDYINSHDGEPQFWQPLPMPPDGMNGPNCGCDGCTEQYSDSQEGAGR